MTDLVFDPRNASVLYASFSGFDEGTPEQSGHLFKSTNVLDVSPTWANVSPGPNIPHNTIAVDPVAPDVLYVGTDLGVWKSIDAGGTWSRETGLPVVSVFDLVFQDVSRRVFAFTHGRGVFVLSSCTSDVDCNDGDPCTTDTCDRARGCLHAAATCDDMNACTVDICSPTSGCIHTPVSCDDGDACTLDYCPDPRGCVHQQRDNLDSLKALITPPDQIGACRTVPASVAGLLASARRLIAKATEQGNAPSVGTCCRTCATRRRAAADGRGREEDPCDLSSKANQARVRFPGVLRGAARQRRLRPRSDGLRQIGVVVTRSPVLEMLPNITRVPFRRVRDGRRLTRYHAGR